MEPTLKKKKFNVLENKNRPLTKYSRHERKGPSSLLAASKHLLTLCNGPVLFYDLLYYSYFLTK